MKTGKISPSNLEIWYHLIEAKVSLSFDEMVAIVFGGVDFHDPTTNVRGRRALAIAKPTPKGYWSRRSTINLTTKVCFLHANEEQARKLRLQSGYCEYKMKALLMKVGFCDVLVWSLNTNEGREVAAMANF